MAKRDVVRRDNKNRILRVGESQRKDGKYMFKYYVGGKPYFLTSWRLLPSDRQPKGTKPTLSLRELEKQIGRDFDTGLNRNLQNMTVRELVDRYLATKINVKPNTRVNYTFVKNLMEKQPFYDKKIKCIRVSDAKLLLIKLHDEGCGSSTIKSVRGVLRPAFQLAVDDDILIKNPFSFMLADVLVNDSKTREAISRKQMRSFLKFIKDDICYCKYYEVIYILFHTGMRISEFCGLTIQDIDFDARTINIDKQLQRIGMKLTVESTKTNAGTRVLPMSDGVLEMFKSIIANRKPQNNEQVVEGYSGFLYLDKAGLPLVAMHWQHRMNHMVKRYNDIYKEQMPNITPHVCRHTYCSNMAKSGMNPKTLQYLMGHSDIGITLNTYTHLGLQDAKDEMERLKDAQKELDKDKVKELPATKTKFRIV